MAFQTLSSELLDSLYENEGTDLTPALNFPSAALKRQRLQAKKRRMRKSEEVSEGVSPSMLRYIRTYAQALRDNAVFTSYDEIATLLDQIADQIEADDRVVSDINHRGLGRLRSEGLVAELMGMLDDSRYVSTEEIRAAAELVESGRSNASDVALLLNEIADAIDSGQYL